MSNQLTSDKNVDVIINTLELTPDPIGQSCKNIISRDVIINYLTMLEKISENSSLSIWIPPSEIRNHVQTKCNKLNEAMDVVKSLSLQDKNIIIPLYMRRKMIELHMETKSAETDNLRSIEMDIFQIIKSLEKLERKLSILLKSLNKEVKGPGQTKNPSNYGYDMIFCICSMYTNLMGYPPSAYPDGCDHQIINGKIIDLLEYILPFTSYPNQCSRTALYAKYKKMKKLPQYKSLWKEL